MKKILPFSFNFFKKRKERKVEEYHIQERLVQMNKISSRNITAV